MVVQAQAGQAAGAPAVRPARPGDGRTEVGGRRQPEDVVGGTRPVAEPERPAQAGVPPAAGGPAPVAHDARPGRGDGQPVGQGAGTPTVHGGAAQADHGATAARPAGAAVRSLGRAAVRAQEGSVGDQA